MLESLKLRALGSASITLQKAVSRQVERLVTKLLISGASLWREERYHRWDERELSCSVRFFYFCERVLQMDQAAWPLVHIEYDAVQPTLRMLLGMEDPSHAPRPDFSVLVGNAKIRVEAKRLRPSGDFPALYVRRGMARFIEGKYISTRPHPGVMIGYIEEGSPAVIVERINSIVGSDPTLGLTHALIPINTTNASFVLACHSTHGNGLRLLHFEIDFQDI